MFGPKKNVGKKPDVPQQNLGIAGTSSFSNGIPTRVAHQPSFRDLWISRCCMFGQIQCLNRCTSPSHIAKPFCCMWNERLWHMQPYAAIEDCPDWKCWRNTMDCGALIVIVKGLACICTVLACPLWHCLSLFHPAWFIHFFSNIFVWGSCFWFCIPSTSPPSACFVTHTTLSHTIFQTQLCHTPLFQHNFVTHHLSNTTLSHTIFHTQLCHTQVFHTQLCHTPFFTHNFVTHHLSHTTLLHTIFHTQLCHTPSFTHNFVTHHLSHKTLSQQLCHKPFFTYNFVTHHLSHTQLCHTPSFTHNFVTHHLSHKTLSHTTLSHTILHIQL